MLQPLARKWRDCGRALAGAAEDRMIPGRPFLSLTSENMTTLEFHWFLPGSPGQEFPTIERFEVELRAFDFGEENQDSLGMPALEQVGETVRLAPYKRHYEYQVF